jgi:uncharacterized protein YxeA
MKTIIVAIILVSATGCASSSVLRASDVHNNNLNAAIDKALDKQETDDKLRVGHTSYNFNTFYQYGTSMVVIPYNPSGI